MFLLITIRIIFLLQYFSDKISEYYGVDRANNQFLKFIHASPPLLILFTNLDHIVRMEFQSFIIGREQLKESVENLSRDSVVIGQVEVNGETKDVKGTVKARLFSYEKSVPIIGTLQLFIVDTKTNATIHQETIESRDEWDYRMGKLPRR